MKYLKAGDTARSRQLISQGANVNGKDENGGTPLYYQVAKATSIRDKKPEYDELVRQMLDHDSPRTTTDDDAKLAFYAGAAFGHTAILEKLLKAGTDVNSEIRIPRIEERGISAHTVAAEHGQLSTVEYLLNHGASSNPKPDITGRTPLIAAFNVANPDPQIIKALVAHGANVDAKTTSRQTPLMWASLRWADTCAKILIDSKANVNAVDGQGGTAL